MSMGKTWVVWALMGSIAFAAIGCDKLGLSAKKEASQKDDDDDDSDSKSKKKKKHHKKSSDDDDDDDSKSSNKDSKKSATNPLPPSTVTPITGEKFAGIYRSTWGDVTVHQTGTQIDCAYPAGTMTCNASGVDLDCTWKEGSTSGKAKLKKLGNGNLDGTWGNNGSASDGGRWLFTLLSAGDPGQNGTEAQAGSFAGTYISTWGDTVFTEQGGTVAGHYPGGTLDCAPSAANLECTWKEGGSVGKAHLTRQADGDISGTWGNGASATNGGTWLFRKK